MGGISATGRSKVSLNGNAWPGGAITFMPATRRVRRVETEERTRLTVSNGAGTPIRMVMRDNRTAKFGDGTTTSCCNVVLHMRGPNGL